MNEVLATSKRLDEIEVSGSAEFESKRTELVYSAAEIERVTNAEEQEVAVLVGKDIKGLLNKIEKSRKEVKQPVLDLGRRIDAVAKEVSGQLAAEYKRITGLIAGFQQAEAARVAEENRKRQEAIEKERRELEAKQKAEAEAQAALDREAQTQNAEQQEAAIEKAVEAEEQRKEAQDNFAQAVYQEKSEVAKVEGSGLTTKMVLKWEVEDIDALLAHDKKLLRIEPNKTMINAAVNAAGKDGKIPGLKIWEEAAASIRG